VEGSANASYSTTAHGDPSSAAVAMINIPVIEGTFALRAVIYDDKRGGYIHNVPATFTRSPTDAGIAYYFGGVVPKGSSSLSNSGLVSNAFNPQSLPGGPPFRPVSVQRRLESSRAAKLPEHGGGRRSQHRAEVTPAQRGRVRRRRRV